MVAPARVGGLPTLRDTRVAVSMVLGQIAAGATTGEILDDYPYLESKDITAALAYASALAAQHY